MSAERAIARSEHTMQMRRHRDMGAWYAECAACPDWRGRLEPTEFLARRRFTEHANGWMFFDHAPGVGVPRRGGPRHAATSRVNVERILTRVVFPIMLAGTAAFILWAGLVSA